MGTQQEVRWIEEPGQSEHDDWSDSRHRLEHQVEIQSRQIESVLSRHQVDAQLQGGSIRPHWVNFDLTTQLAEGWDRVRRLTGELATALGVPEVRLQRDQGRLRLSVRRFEPHPVDLLDLLDLLPEIGGLSLPLGLDHQGRPALLNLAQADLHNVLIAGVSGAGKSSLMRSIAVSLALSCRQSQAQLAVIALGSEPSGITTRPNPLYPVNYLPHLLFPVATGPEEALEALDYLVQEAAYRAENGITSPILVILVDDADMLLRRAGRPAADLLGELMHQPVAAGVRVIAAAANPALPDLQAILQHNIDLRLVGRMADERLARFATGRDDLYAHYLEGKGDFIAISAASINPFQAAYIDDYDLHLTLTELHRASEPTLLAQSLRPRPSAPPSWSDAGAHGFTYDPVSARVALEPDDRSRYATVEMIAIDPLDDDRPPHRPSPGDNGAARLEERTASVDGPDPDRPQHHGSPAADTHIDDDFSEPADPPSRRPTAAVDDSAGPGSGPYEMLPFDEDSFRDEPARSGPAAGQDTERSAANSSPAATSSPVQSGDARPAVFPRAQALWPVEPTYTDIDDDMWDLSADEDDWRNRLH